MQIASTVGGIICFHATSLDADVVVAGRQLFEWRCYRWEPPFDTQPTELAARAWLQKSGDGTFGPAFEHEWADVRPMARQQPRKTWARIKIDSRSSTRSRTIMPPSASKQKRLAEKAAKQAAKAGSTDASSATGSKTGSKNGSLAGTPLTSVSAATSQEDLSSMAKLQVATERRVISDTLSSDLTFVVAIL